MRNNYNGAAFQNITELENIKITAAHEFFHAIQFSYNCYERFWLMEATAVWFEDEIYNEINDHYRYMPSWFQNSTKPIDDESSHMYGSFIFFQYIDEHLGGYETIKNIWERSRSNANSVNDVSFTSINEALESVGSSFSGALNNMRIANRIMSSHPNANPFTYLEAEAYPVTGPLEIAQLYFEDQIISNLITKAEKNLGQHLNEINIMIDSPSIYSLDFCVQKNYEKKNNSKSLNLDYSNIITQIKKLNLFDTLKFKNYYKDDYIYYENCKKKLPENLKLIFPNTN